MIIDLASQINISLFCALVSSIDRNIRIRIHLRCEVIDDGIDINLVQ
jgi:hypothetical protein